MSTKIDKRIVKYRVEKPADKTQEKAAPAPEAARKESNVVWMHEEIEYDGELHSAANLFDALKEGYYGKF